MAISNNDIAQYITSEFQLGKEDNHKTYVSKEVLEQAQTLNNNHKVPIVVDNEIIVLQEKSVKSLKEDFKEDINIYNGVIIVKDGAKSYLKKIINNLSQREHSALMNNRIDTHIVQDIDRKISPIELAAKKAYHEQELINTPAEKRKFRVS